MLMIRSAFVVGVIILAGVPNAFARNPRVTVSVTAPPGFDTRITSLINKHLRELGDVDLGEGPPDFKIEVIALEENFGGSSQATLSVGVNLLAVMRSLGDVLKAGAKCLGESERHRLTVLQSAESRVQLLMFSISPDHIDRMSADVVSAFDVRCLEPARHK